MKNKKRGKRKWKKREKDLRERKRIKFKLSELG